MVLVPFLETPVSLLFYCEIDQVGVRVFAGFRLFIVDLPLLTGSPAGSQTQREVPQFALPVEALVVSLARALSAGLVTGLTLVATIKVVPDEAAEALARRAPLAGEAAGVAV